MPKIADFLSVPSASDIMAFHIAVLIEDRAWLITGFLVGMVVVVIHGENVDRFFVRRSMRFCPVQR